jgi:hypothetical protein
MLGAYTSQLLAVNWSCGLSAADSAPAALLALMTGAKCVGGQGSLLTRFLDRSNDKRRHPGMRLSKIWDP